MVKVAQPRCFCRCWGAKCRACGAWVTKHDNSFDDAFAVAVAADHKCGRIG